ncbi:MAG: protein kinase [Pirellulaceae bacterium]
MDPDYTQQQSLGGLRKSEQLSLQATVPPAEIAGYSLERLLGQGAFGQVWLGVDLNTRRHVAIKFYLHRGSMNLPALSREVSHLVNMSAGRHIVQVLAVGWDADPPYYVMEYLENGSLEDLMRASGALSTVDMVSMLREIAEGLSYAHAKGVLHCDLKPANVVLDHAWRPRLADFGQGRMTNEQTPSLGTLFYMAPEQADLNASPDVAWDVYALGAIGYTMLVGSPPYRTPEVVESLDTANTLPDRLACYRQTIDKAPKPRLHYRRRGIDKALCQIIDRCLAVDPARRFGNVQQVIGAIDSRARARTRKPLYLVGIVGPVLLLLLMLLFSMRSISLATQDSMQSVAQRSLESNKFAARFVARGLESEFQSLFRLVEEESRRDELRNLLTTTRQQNEQLLDSLASSGEHQARVAQLLQDNDRQALEEYMKLRMNAMIRKGDDGRAAIFNTLFVTEQLGTIVAIAFSSSEEQSAKSPVGGNYAYRSYFNGNRADALDRTKQTNYPATRTTRLSAPFRSTATGAWKVGVSAPVWHPTDYDSDGETPLPMAQPLGVLVLTINLGDFELLSQEEAGSDANSLADEGEQDPYIRFAAIVDGRSDNQRGTLLQHPWIQRMDRETMKTESMPRIDPRVLETLQNSGGVLEYEDPAAQKTGGTPFQGTWIASLEQVSLPRVNESSGEVRTKSDLWILMQERSSSVAAPIRKLGSKLQIESFIELGTLLLVILVLWYFVFRIGQNTLGGATSGAASHRSSDSAFQSTLESDR